MTKRLQVLLDDEELAHIQAAARARKLTVAAWVRGALRAAREDPATAAARKLAALRQSNRYEFPTADMEAMLAEIESGYSEGSTAADRGGRRSSHGR
jgi:hypothetical protein